MFYVVVFSICSDMNQSSKSLSWREGRIGRKRNGDKRQSKQATRARGGQTILETTRERCVRNSSTWVQQLGKRRL